MNSSYAYRGPRVYIFYLNSNTDTHTLDSLFPLFLLFPISQFPRFKPVYTISNDRHGSPGSLLHMRYREQYFSAGEHRVQSPLWGGTSQMALPLLLDVPCWERSNGIHVTRIVRLGGYQSSRVYTSLNGLNGLNGLIEYV